MTGKQIINKMKKLDLPKGQYIVFGSCPMALVGIRESQDIDMLVSRELFDQLKAAGWQEVDKGKDDKPLAKDDFEAHYNWDFSSYSPSLEQLLASATVADGIPFASIDNVRKWKAASGRPKDLVDVKLIDEYLSNQA